MAPPRKSAEREAPLVRLVHFDEAEARTKIRLLEQQGFRVAFDPIRSGADLPKLRQGPPDVVVIDLSRLPMQGRDMGVSVRRYKATRNVPLVFVGGETEKAARVRELLPDASFTTWRSIRKAMADAIESAAKPERGPAKVVPGSMLAGYSGTPLPRKLGIKPGAVVALVGAPDGFERTLVPMPEGVSVRRHARGKWDLAIWFVTSRSELDRRIARMFPPRGGGLWVAWPKKASGVRTDVTQADVRTVGLDAGLVDHKICAIDPTWSGLRFVVRKE